MLNLSLTQDEFHLEKALKAFSGGGSGINKKMLYLTKKNPNYDTTYNGTWSFGDNNSINFNCFFNYKSGNVASGKK
jgi:hypothetical protein